MRTISVSEAKNNLSKVLRAVRGGATVVITDRGVPVARLSPATASEGVPPAIAELARRTVARIPDGVGSADWLELDWPRPKGRASAVRALLEEREGGR
jgi:prevent-host-death family protein